MGFAQSVAICFRKFFIFSGRATRSEFWQFYLFYLVLSFLIGFIEVTNLMILILAIPLCAVASRRLHDTGKSGWWSLLALTGIGILPLLVWCATDTKQKDNKYGPLEQS